MDVKFIDCALKSGFFYDFSDFHGLQWNSME